MYLSSVSRYDLAIPIWRELLQKCPDHEHGLKSLAYLLKRVKQFDEELQVRSQLIEMFPRNGISFVERSVVLIEMGRFEEAMQDMERAESLLSMHELDQVNTIINQGCARLHVGRFAEAFKYFDKILRRSKLSSHRFVSRTHHMRR